ncbi:MAG: hypothetical protein II684_02800 [Treponema sp.]|nr:hypothetical protein [Treponema sp.]
MVKHIRMIAAVCTVAILTLVGCSNIGDATASNGNDETTAVEFSLASKTPYYALIGPGKVDLDDTDSPVTYKISGESATGLLYPPANSSASTATAAGEPIEIAFDETGKKTLTGVVVDDWTFTLYAYQNGNLVLKGTSKCAIKSSGANSVKFTLSSYGVETKGSYEVTIKYTGTTNAWDSAYNLAWALYDETTGKLLANDGTASTSAAINDLTAANSAAVASTGVKVDATNVKPGTYIFRVRIMNSGTEYATSFDHLTVEPGRKTIGSLEFGDIISTRPAAPASLQVQLLNNDNFKPSTGDFYTVRLYWPVSSTMNEESYELIVKEFINTSTAPLPHASSVTATTINAEEFTHLYDFGDILELKPGTSTTDNPNTFNIGYKAGSLYAGSTELVLLLPTGRMFDFQIRAKNSIGPSDATLRSDATKTIGDNPVAVTSLSAASDNKTTSLSQTNLGTGYLGAVLPFEIANATPAYHKHVVVTQVKYILNGGTWKIDSANNDASAVKTDYIIYDKNYAAYEASMNDSAKTAAYIPLTEINPTKNGDGTANDSYPKLTNSAGVDFTQWNYSYGNALITDIKYNILGYKNIAVTAIYGSTTGDITVAKTDVSVEEIAELESSAISIASGTNAQTENSTAYNPTTGISVGRGTAAQYVTVKVTTAATFAGGYYELWINGTLRESLPYVTTGLRFSNFSTADLNKGVENEILVKAVTASGKVASAKTTIKLTN